ncbi:double jelly roll capsid protein [Vibrio phage 1.249.A._10N.261.55.B9]|uniref:Double jelly roll capsid protein n=2 Tax=Autolykiviridae TaxID=2184034 RepID=A0A2I7RXG1_9VIRU|nr:major head protein [Vibrio phage 1.249.A._10N.261.55.B9]AUR98305.1 double jelly roll capsid protein [Vibrio phage 1.249.A._10N.261.55.B9]AUR98327.1 double jelly roll capsid protein [Vibrio phage 1.249.B._10N.261.55.B9]
MARIEVRMPAGEGIAAGQTATFKLPIGRRFHELQLAYSGVTLAQMTEIRIFANGKVIHRYSGSDRDSMNKFDKRAAASGVLTIPFDRYKLKTLAGEEETALNTGSADANGVSITSVYMEIDIAAAASAPVMSLTATQSDALPGGPGTVLHVQRHTRDAAGAGEFDISDLPRGTATSIALNRIFFKPSANDIAKVTIERNQYTIFERSKALNEVVQTDGVRTPQSGFVVVDKTERGYGGDPIDLVGVSDFRYKLDMTGTATLTIYSEYLGRLGD